MQEPILWQGNCLDLMQQIPDGSVDMILCDLPYGTTACKWDTVIPFEPLWAHYKRLIKKNGAIVLFSGQPFTSKLVCSNLEMFKYQWVWEKEQGVNFQLANKQPMKVHEDICVFSEGSHNYQPQGLTVSGKKKSNTGKGGNIGHNSSEACRTGYIQEFSGYPRSVQKFNRQVGHHPTQKPVALCEYLIRTYTNEGETVLDNTMGSGTTGVACVNTGRQFIGIERDDKYFEIAKSRILSAYHREDLSLI